MAEFLPLFLRGLVTLTRFVFMDLSIYISQNYFQFTSSLTQVVIVYYAIRQISCFVKYGVWINSTTYCILLFLFIARIRFSACDSLIGVLRKRYGRELAMEVGTLEKMTLNITRQFCI